MTVLQPVQPQRPHKMTPIDQQKDEAAKGEDANNAGNHVAEEDL